LRFFDAEMGVGRSGLGYAATETGAELLAVMDRYGIERALVYDRGSHESGVFDEFEFVLGFCRASARLEPAIPVVPPACGEQPGPDELVRLILERGVKAVRACPAAHHFRFDPFSMGRLLGPLEEHRIPVLYVSMHVRDHPWLHAPGWEDIRAVAAAFPELPLVVVYTGMLQGRRLLPVLEGCPNVRVDLTCASFQFVEHVVERFGSERLVLASHFPCEDPGLYTSWLNYANVSGEAREAMAHGNLERLVEGIR